MIRLEEVDPDNWRPGLRVREDQRNFVSDSSGLLARAWAYRKERSQARVICDGETPVGMVLWYDFDELGAYDFSQLFIDARFQNRGFGESAARAVIDEMRADGKYDKVVLCYIEGNMTARRMYEKIGFRETGERYEDEIVMEMRL